MERLRIGMTFADGLYARKLARRLCELCPGLQIDIRRPGEPASIPAYDVLLAEEAVLKDEALQAVCSVRLTREECFLPAPAILEKILDACGPRSGRLLSPRTDIPVRFLVFSAATGGAGTTAAALTLGRILAGVSEQEVLYLEGDAGRSGGLPGGWEVYTKVTDPALRPAAELSYRLRQQQDVRLQPYLAKDFYGLHFLSLPVDSILNLQAQPDLLAGFGTVIVDCGTATDPRLAGTRLHLVNRADSRRGLWPPETSGADEEIRIENRGSSYQADERHFVLTNDPQSFVRQGDKDGGSVEIAQNGIFARDLRRMAEALLFFHSWDGKKSKQRK